MSYRLGIDIGGTFTDLVLLEEQTGKLFFGKTLTTYDNPSNGIINGTSSLLKKEGISATHLTGVVHGTTLVTNAVIERRGVKTGLITTLKFEDVLEIGRELRYDIYDIFITIPEPLIPRNLRLGVKERINHKGEILEPLDMEMVAKQVKKLIDLGVQSIAVCLLNSYTNPIHELAIKDYITAHYPEIYVSISAEIMPEIREYERTSATAMNAYVQPITDQYLKNLELRLKEEVGFEGAINIMISSGRLTTIDGARKTPIHLLESGPAGGTMATVFFGNLTNRPNLLAFDMGGTTAKASIINDLKPEITNQFEAGRVSRFKKGSGLPVRIPVIDMIEIGAGGGSIAMIDNLGLLKVGPESAASEPGPVCYQKGGQNPTVTDADLVLGYLNPDYFLGGQMKLDVEATKKALQEKIGDKLGISAIEAALGIYRIVNENMANAARVHILEKGLDPRFYSMMAFGGAGPIHAFQVARLLGSPQLIIPVGAGVVSALGFLVSPIASEQIRSYVAGIQAINWIKLNQLLQEMENEGFKFLENAGLETNQGKIKRVADMRYSGQGHEISIEIPNGNLSENSILEIKENFNREYAKRYGRVLENIGIEAVTWRVVVEGPTPVVVPQQMIEEKEKTTEIIKGHRLILLPSEKDYISVPVYNRYLLNQKHKFNGPCIIEEMESTVVVGKNADVSLDEFNNIIINLN